uniref:Uncharacterized protein n=1 Tax=Anguilla anguilla TaxID=7936 RepID=A0A0E9SPW7_ANGAN
MIFESAKSTIDRL